MTQPGAPPSATAAGTIAWGADPHRFELHAAHPDVLARAAVVFRPWLLDPHDGSRPAVRTYSIVEDAAGNGDWQIATSDGSHLLSRPTLARAVAAVEFLAVGALAETAAACTAHAALLARDGRGVLILGPNESGKSTLACALWQQGFDLLGDDTTLIDLDTAMARPAPRRVALRTTSRDLVGDALWMSIQEALGTDRTDEGWLFLPDDLGGSRPDAVRIVACFMLARHGAAPRATTEPLTSSVSAGVSALALLPYTSVARTHDAGTAIARFAPFASRVRTYDLRRAPLAAMTAVVDAVLTHHAP